MTEADKMMKSKKKRETALAAERISAALNDAHCILDLGGEDTVGLHDHIVEFMGLDVVSDEESSDSDESEMSDLDPVEEAMDIDDSESDTGSAVVDDEENPPMANVYDEPTDDEVENEAPRHAALANPDDADEPVVIEDLAQNIMDEVGTDDFVSPDNDEEKAKVENFNKCRCRGRECLKQFDSSFVMKLRAQMVDADMTKDERKMFVLGKMSTTIRCTQLTQKSRRNQQTDRKRSRVTYMVEGKNICRETFLFMHQ